MVTSTSNQMFVIFHSDAMQTSRGFSASYHAGEGGAGGGRGMGGGEVGWGG